MMMTIVGVDIRLVMVHVCDIIVDVYLCWNCLTDIIATCTLLFSHCDINIRY